MQNRKWVKKRICTKQAPHKVGASKDIAKPNGIHGVNIRKKTLLYELDMSGVCEKNLMNKSFDGTAF